MKRLFKKLLQFYAKTLLKKHNPYIIWITWTVWKTTLRKLVFDFLKYKELDISTPNKNYNSGTGLPLAILEFEINSKLDWLKLPYVFCKQYFREDYPAYLILEYWIDSPNDMEELVWIANPNLIAITNIQPNHTENFETSDDYILEKKKIYKNRIKNRLIITNSNDENCTDIPSWKCFWEADFADARAVTTKQDEDVLICDFRIWTKYYNVTAPIFWEYIAELFSAASLIIEDLWYLPDDLFNWITENFKLTPWRWNFLNWWVEFKNVKIIDWSYNWWYNSISSWLNSLFSIKTHSKKMALLWDMRELWTLSKQFHELLAHQVKNSNLEFAAFVWEESNEYIKPILSKIDPNFNKFRFFKDSRKAWDWLASTIIEDKSYLLFVKWSQNTIYLEEWIKSFISKSDYSQLVRQSIKYLKIKNKFFKSLV